MNSTFHNMNLGLRKGKMIHSRPHSSSVSFGGQEGAIM